MFEIFGLLLLLVFAIFWIPYVTKTEKFGAPFVTAEPKMVERMMNLAQVKKGDVFYDLGSGDGRLVISAALRGAKSYGVEIDLLRVLYSRFWIWLLRLSKNAKIIRKNFFDVNLSKADVVSLFLLQKTNQKLKNKLKKELKPGARIVSYGFTFEGWQPKKVDTRPNIYGPIYLYKIS